MLLSFLGKFAGGSKKYDKSGHDNTAEVSFTAFWHLSHHSVMPLNVFCVIDSFTMSSPSSNKLSGP